MMKWPILTVFCIAGFLPCFGQNKNAREAQLMAEFNQLLHTPFPAFRLEDVNGDTFNTAQLRGKTIFIDFWFSQCPPCLKELPYAAALQNFFKADTTIVFVNVCIEPVERKDAWRQMVENRHIGGINLFYAKNRPQKVNLLRQYKVEDFPTYMILNSSMEIIGHHAPYPSDKGLIQWCIQQATRNKPVSSSYKEWINQTREVKDYLETHRQSIDSLYAEVK